MDNQMVRVHNFVVSSDGYGAGEGQSLETPFGHANPGELMAWAGATASWPNRADPGGSRGLDDYLVRDFHRNIGAEIMGRNKFSPYRGPWEDHPEWEGWWGEETPFHTPVFVMTHHERPPLTLTDTTFHFVTGSPEEVLAQAFEAADGKDVRLGGGATTIREFLDAGLIDTLHVAVSPVELGAGSRFWSSPDDLLDRYHRDVVPSPGGSVVHHLFWRD
ncbi:dihydrofolate reductase family protein [Nocardioides sp. CN2-186]|uniref:dihydrofolate reductase family protein n=1 Tax=Nocardioides tweenelious TaxID=3156607 RepID=UPI0032B4679D